MAGPLADAGATGVGQYDAVDLLESLQDAVALHGEADLLGAGGDGEFGFELSGPWRPRIFGDVGRAVQVFVAGVGAGADEADFEHGGELKFVDGGGEFADGEGAVRRVGAVDVGFEGIEVDLDYPVEVLSRGRRSTRRHR